MRDHRVRLGANIAFAALVVAIFLRWLFHATDWGMRAHLTIVGALLEVAGVALLSIDFWWPPLARISSTASRRLVREARAGVHQLRTAARLFRRRTPATATGSARLGTAVEIDTAGEVTSAGGGQQVIRRLYELERRMGEVESRQESAAHELDSRLEALTREVEEMIERSKDRYLGLRVIGLAIAFAGAVLLSAANLVSS